MTKLVRYNCAASEADCISEAGDLGFTKLEDAQIWSGDRDWKTYEITIEVKEYVPPPAELKISVEDSI